MAASLIVVVALLLWCPTNGKEQYIDCCPEDDQHLYMYEERMCNASSRLGLPCLNESDVVTMREGRDAYWMRQSDGAVVVGTTIIGTLLAPDSFCVARMGFQGWTVNSTNETVFKVEHGIVYCAETEFYATYLGPEPLSYAVCLMISAVGCFLTFITYILVPVLHKDLLGKCLMCALISFTLMYLSIGISTFEAHRMPHSYCSFQIFFMLFWTVASVFWTNVISFDIWRSVIFRRFPLGESHLLKVYFFWGWGIPCILTLAGWITNDPLSEGLDECFISPLLLFCLYVIPSLILLFCNLIYFLWTICKLWRQEPPNSPSPNATRLRRLRYKCLLCVKLFLVMGIPWIIRVISAYLPGSNITRILLNIMAILQGLFVFLLLVVFRKKALLGLAGLFAKWGCPCPFMTTNFAVTLHDEDDDDDDNADRVDHDDVELNTQTATATS